MARNCNVSFTHTGYAYTLHRKAFCFGKKSLYSTNSSGTELQHVALTSEGVVHLIPVFTSATVGSNPRSCLFIVATVLIDVHTAPKCLTEPIRYVMNHFQDRRGAASLRYRNRTEITVVRELLQRRRQRQRERQKINGFVKQNNNFARASRFFVTTRLPRENAWFHALWRT